MIVRMIRHLLAGKASAPSAASDAAAAGGDPPPPGAPAPEAPAATLERAKALRDAGATDAAEDLLREALAAFPGAAELHNELGKLFKSAGNTHEALACFRRAVELAPADADAHANLASVLLQHGQVEPAQAHLRKALAIAPQHPEAQWNLMFSLLLVGDYEAGLTLHEKRFWTGPPAQRQSAQEILAVFKDVPPWKGGALGGRNLLLWSEQGLGDSLMMLRYLPLVAQRHPAALDVWCEPALVRLVQTFPCLAHVLSKDEALPLRPNAVQCSLMSLPYIFQTRLDSIPRDVPYLPVPAELARPWRERLGRIPGLKVGLVWSGNPLLQRDALRSIALDRLAPVLAAPGVRFVSLQKGAPAQQHATAAPAMIDWMDECHDLLDTAALVCALDLVIAVDTSVAHLAGALGKPVWLFNRYESEWRWGLTREDSPWYPSLRIFRQPALHDWDSVIERVATELRAWSAATAVAGSPASATAPQAEACKAQGNAHLARGELEEAGAAYRRALAIDPDYAEAHNNLGLVHAAQGRLDDALACYRRALDIHPGLGQAHTNLGNAYKNQGRLDAALASYRQAVAVSPGLASVHNNLGVHLLELARLDEAQTCFESAIALQPDFAEAHNNLGNVWRGQNRLDEALACFERAIALRPDLAKAHNNRGVVCQDRGRLAEAYAAYRAALAIDPDYAEAYSNYVFAKQYDPACAAAELCAEHRGFAARFEAPLRAAWPAHANVRAAQRRLKIGFVSGDLRTHPVGFFLENILAYLDRAALAITLYPTSPRSDALTARLRAADCAWQSLVGLADEDAARRIRADGVDILVDLSGHTADNRLLVFARKPAPVQVSWLYFSTTGLSAIDYLLCDAQVVPPDEEVHFVERPWRLPDSYLCFTPPREDVAVGPLPARHNGCVTFGCFNSLSKLNDAVVALWAKVLLAVPNARLFLKATQLNDASTRAALAARFAAHGVAPGRLLLEGPSPRAEYLASYNRVDIALDPFPFPGGTTTVEALWMSVPVLARRGDRFIAHAGESILHTVGLPDWIAHDDADYITKAAAYARDLDALATLRAGLRERFLASPLCDAPRFARNLEAAFRGMWRAYCARS